MINCLNLCKAGYGSLKEIMDLDAPEFLDILDYESISNDIHNHNMKNGQPRPTEVNEGLD